MLAIAGVAILGLCYVRWRGALFSAPHPASDVFLLIFTLYTAPLLLEQGLFPAEHTPFYERQLTAGGFSTSYRSGAIAALSFVIGVVAVTSRSRRRNRSDRKVWARSRARKLDIKMLRISSFGISLGSILIAMASHGIGFIISSGRAGRHEIGPLLFFTYAPLYIAVVVSHLGTLDHPDDRNYVRSLKRLRNSSLAALAIVSLVNGDRRFLVYSFIVIGLEYYPQQVAKDVALRVVQRAKAGLKVAFLLLALLLFAKYRWAIPMIWQGEADIGDAVRRTQTVQDPGQWWRPSQHEFGGPAISLFGFQDYAASPTGFGPIGLGVTYLSGIISLIPGAPPSTLATDFAAVINGGPHLSGYGFSPAAEAALNFGKYFAFIGGMIIGAYLNLVDRVRGSHRWRFHGAILLFLSLDLVRMSLSFREPMYLMIVATFIIASADPSLLGLGLKRQVARWA